MRLTETMTVTLARGGAKSKSFRVPLRIARQLEAILVASTKPIKKEKPLPVEQVFPYLSDEVAHGAALLRGARYKAGLTQKDLAARLGVLQHHLSEMENAKRPIGKQMAKRLAQALDCDYRLFI